MSISGISFYFGFGSGNNTDNSTQPAPAEKPEDKKPIDEYSDGGLRPFDYSFGTSPSVIFGDKWNGNLFSSTNAPMYPSEVIKK